MTKPNSQDLENARRWWVETMGYLNPIDDPKVVSLAHRLAESRGTLDELCAMQTRALVQCEWSGCDGPDSAPCCPVCIAWWHGAGARHLATCVVDAALNAAGLDTPELRDAMREELAKR